MIKGTNIMRSSIFHSKTIQHRAPVVHQPKTRTKGNTQPPESESSSRTNARIHCLYMQQPPPQLQRVNQAQGCPQGSTLPKKQREERVKLTVSRKDTPLKS